MKGGKLSKICVNISCIEDLDKVNKDIKYINIDINKVNIDIDNRYLSNIMIPYE